MKRLISAFAICILFITLFSALAFADSKSYTVSPQAAYFKDVPIPLYEIDGEKAIMIEDLEKYGYNMSWSDFSRTTTLDFNSEKTVAGGALPRYTDGNIYESDISIYVNSKGVPSFNTGGYSLVRLSDLSEVFAISERDGAVHIDAEKYLQLLVSSPVDIQKLANSKGLESLSLVIQGPQRSDINFSGLSQLPNLRELDIFIDSNLAECLESIKDIRQLESLNISFSSMPFDYAGYDWIESLTSLKKLSLHTPNENISYGFLSKLPLLEDLSIDLFNNKDISFLENLKGLKRLELDGGLYEDFSTLGKLDKLRDLTLTDNYTSKYNKIETIANMKALENLRIESGGMIDPERKPFDGIDWIGNLTELKNLWIRTCGVQDISPVSNLQKLESADFGYNKISDIKPVGSLKNLTTLKLMGNPFSDVSALSSLSKLEEVYIGQSDVSDISVLSNLKKLKTVSAPYAQISSIEGFNNLPELKILDLSVNAIKRIGSPKIFPSLEELDMSYNQLSSIDGLSNLKSLKKLNISSNSVYSLAPLANTPLLEEFSADENKLVSLSLIEKLPALKILSIQNNSVSSLEPLRNRHFEQLNILDNPVKDYSPVYDMYYGNIAMPLLDDRDGSYTVKGTLIADPEKASTVNISIMAIGARNEAVLAQQPIQLSAGTRNYDFTIQIKNSSYSKNSAYSVNWLVLTAESQDSSLVSQPYLLEKIRFGKQVVEEGIVLQLK